MLCLFTSSARDVEVALRLHLEVARKQAAEPRDDEENQSRQKSSNVSSKAHTSFAHVRAPEVGAICSAVEMTTD